MISQAIFESVKYVNSSDEIKNNMLYSEVDKSSMFGFSVGSYVLDLDIEGGEG